MEEVENKIDTFVTKVDDMENKIDKLVELFKKHLTKLGENTRGDTVEGVLLTGGEGWMWKEEKAKQKWYDKEETFRDSGITSEVFIPATGQICSFPDLPKERSQHTLNTMGNAAIACGGFNKEQWKSCYKLCPLSKTGLWTRYAATVDVRKNHNSWVSEEGLHLFGGEHKDYQDETYIVYPGITTELLPSTGFQSIVTSESKYNLTQYTWGACTIADKDSVVVTGGGSGNHADLIGGGTSNMKMVARYNLQGHVSNLPDMNTGRRRHGCGSYTSNGDMVLIVAGGSDGSNLQSSTEKLKQGDSAWTIVNPLPWPLERMASVSVGQKIFFFGGDSDYEVGYMMSEILVYEEEAWKLVGHMNRRAKDVAATKITTGYESHFCK